MSWSTQLGAAWSPASTLASVHQHPTDLNLCNEESTSTYAPACDNHSYSKPVACHPCSIWMIKDMHVTPSGH